MSNFNFLVFDDHGADWTDLLDLLLKRAKSPLIAVYTDRVATILRREISKDTRLSKDDSWAFSTIHELRDLIERHPQNWPLSLQAAITCLSQIGLYLDHVQMGGFQTPKGEYLSLGLGIGALAAAVATCAGGVNDILALCPTAIALSFRLGSLAETKLQGLFGTRRENHASTWASMCVPLPEPDVRSLVEKFNSQHVYSSSKKCYITSVSESRLVVSGPFMTLETFRTEHALTGTITPSLPLSVPCLYSDEEILALCQDTASFVRPEDPESRFDIVSSTSGHFLQSLTGPDVLQNAIKECLSGIRYPEKICKTLSEWSSRGDCTILSLRLSGFSQRIQRILQAESSKTEIKLRSLIHKPASSLPQGSGRPAIAIVGMAGRFPGADDAEQLWELLQAGKDIHRTVPPDRFDYKTHSDPDGKKSNTSRSPYGCFIEKPGLFDARFFNMSPKEAMQTDPAQRLMILTAYEALEMAGFVLNRTPSSHPDRVATFYGQASDDWRETNSSQDIDTYFIPGGIRAFGPGRINYHLKFSGPSFVVDTACSSSFAAIHAACNSLWMKDSDTALAGGANILTNPDIFAGLSRGHFLSSTGSCKTFDAGADGYCRADGVASIVLKRLDDAENDNDTILGLITGIGTNHSAQAVSITHPHAPTQARLYQSLLSNNGVDAHDVDYVEMHGTGTAAGDFNEVLSVSEVFAPRHRPVRKQPVYMSSIKANIGHAEAAAGITSLIKVLQMLRHNAIPPHVGIKTKINPAFPQDLEDRKVCIPLKEEQWTPRVDGTPRVAFLNNFSAAGGNTALILQEYCRPTRNSRNSKLNLRPYHILTISSKTIRSMQMNIERLNDFVSSNPQTSLADLSYTLTARRTAHNFRKSFVVSHLSEVQNILKASFSETFTPIPSKSPRVVFTFTGQGSLYTGLAKDLFRTNQSFRRKILEYDSVAQSEGFPSFLELVDGSAYDLASVQPTILQVGQACVQLALAKLWMSWGIKPDAVIGHSLGEYPALAIAGVLTEADMIYLVGVRAQLLEQNCVPESHGMLAVNTDADALKADLAGTSIEISCSNAPGMTVLGGPREALKRCAEGLQNKGLRCAKLSVVYAYHTAQVEPILNPFAELAKGINFSKPELPVLSSLLGKFVSSNDEGVFGPEYLCRHARESVKFEEAISSLGNQPDWKQKAIWMEIGPHPTCSKFVQKTLGKECLVLNTLYRDKDPWRTMFESVSAFNDQGFKIDWEELHRDHSDHHQLLELPSYAWDLKNFWIDYVNDWSLTKGRVPQQQEIQEQVESGLQTTSVQRIIEEKITPGDAFLVTETDFSEAILRKKAQGHRVNGVALCPSSLYADMAFTVAKYLYQRMLPDQECPAMDVCSMSVDKPLILDQQENLQFHIVASGTPTSVSLELSTGDYSDESKKTIHAKCEVRFGIQKEWLNKWNHKSYLVKERVSALEAAASKGLAHRIQKKLVYRLFSNFVDYNEDYQGIEEVILDSRLFEATALVRLQPTESGAVFEVPPTWIDSLAHITGVILNASDAVDSKEFVYISHGWKSMRILSNLQPGDTYRTYTRMQETGDNVMEGDVWIFDTNAQAIGLVKGVKFQRIPRKVINVLLPHPDSKPAVAKPKQSASKERSTKILQPPIPQVLGSLGTEQTSVIKIPKASVVDEVLLVVSVECGVDLSELIDGCTLSSLGVDSLLSLEILAKLRESLDLDLRPHVFYELETIGDLKTHIQELTGSAPVATKSLPKITPVVINSEFGTPSSSSAPSVAGESSPSSERQLVHSQKSSMTSLNSVPEQNLQPRDNPQPRCASYLLSGNPKTASKVLFIFPDGSGSATSYARLPPFAADTCVYAMNCPFMTQPKSWTSGISAVTKLYLEEIRRRKPKGPYNVAGWSAGGILAYDAALHLSLEGETVDRLILIDSPCPVNLPPMPIKMFTFLDSIGLLGSGNAMGTPDWVIPHFEATVKNLDSYAPAPFPTGAAPTTTTIWARRGVTSKTGGRRPAREEGDPAVMEWLLEDRTDFGGNGWEALIPDHLLRSDTMDGHHFSMVNEHANELGRLMAKAMQ